MSKIKDFLYLDESLVNSIFSQYFQGVITTMTKGSVSKEGLKAGLGFDLKIVKGNMGASEDSETSSNETIDLHHYAYNLIEEQLIADGVIDGESSEIIMLKGDIKVLDADKTIQRFEGLKDLFAGLDAAVKMSNEPTQSDSIPQNVRSAAKESKNIGKLLRELTGNGLFVYIGNERIQLDRNFIKSENSPEFSNNGKLFEGEYVMVGLKSKLSHMQLPATQEDMLLTLTDAFSKFGELVKVSAIKPIAIYRIIDN